MLNSKVELPIHSYNDSLSNVDVTVIYFRRPMKDLSRYDRLTSNLGLTNHPRW
jgi:hypothetical protein